MRRRRPLLLLLGAALFLNLLRMGLDGLAEEAAIAARIAEAVGMLSLVAVKLPMPSVQLSEFVFEAPLASKTNSQYMAAKHSGFGFIFNQSIFLIGARLTLETNGAFVDLLAQPASRLIDIDKKGKRKCTLDKINEPCNSLLGYREASLRVSKCIVNGIESDVFPIPIKSTDGNRVDIMHIWRCKLPSSFRAQPSSSQLVIVSSILNERVALDIPTHSLSVGQFGPVNINPTPFWERRYNMTLCLGGVQSNGLYLLREHIRHHLQIGVDHIVLGLNFPPDSPEHANLTQTFATLLSQGTLTFINLHRQLPILNHEAVLQYFHTSCLYHAKTVSEFVGSWDIDEWWFPRNNQSGTGSGNEGRGSLRNSLVATLRDVAKQVDFCFLTFPSYIMHGHDNDWGGNRSKRLDGGFPSNRTGRVLYDYRWRDSRPNFVYRKSVALSRNAFLATSHVFGSCRGPNNTIVEPTVAIEIDSPCKSSRCGITFYQGGVMRHFYPLFHSDLEHWKVRGKVIDDEWSARYLNGTIYD